MVEGDRTLIFLTCRRKAWHHDLPPGWEEEAFERFNYVECAVFSKPTDNLTVDDAVWISDYGEPDDDFRFPSRWSRRVSGR